MLQELKKKSLRTITPIAVILLAAAVILLFFTGFGIFRAIGGPKPLDSIPFDQVEGQYVTYDATFLYDSYAYTTQTSKTSPYPVTISREYVIPMGYEESRFLGMVAPTIHLSALDKLLDASIDYFNGGELPSSTVTVTGTIMPMDEESLEFFHTTVGYNDADADDAYRSLFLPYYLKIDYLGKTPTGLTYLLTAAAAVCLFSAAFVVIKALTGGYQKDIMTLAAASGDKAYTLEQIDNWYANAEAVSGIRFGPKWTMFHSGARTRLVETSSIVWAYLRQVEHRRNGIKTGTTYGLTMRTLDKKSLEVGMKNPEQVKTALEYLHNHYPAIMLGYTQELDQLYSRDPAQFAQLCSQRQESPSS